MLRICFETEHYKVQTYERYSPFSEITITEYNAEKKWLNSGCIDLENRDKFYKDMYEVFGIYPKEYLIERIDEIKEILHQIINLSSEQMAYVMFNSEGEKVYVFPINEELYMWLKLDELDISDFGYGGYKSSEYSGHSMSDHVSDILYWGKYHYGVLSNSIIRYWVVDADCINKTVLYYIEAAINIKKAREQGDDWVSYLNTIGAFRRELFDKNKHNEYCNAKILKEFADYYVELNWDKKGVKHDRKDFIKFLKDFSKKEIEKLMVIKPTPFLICLNKLIYGGMY